MRRIETEEGEKLGFEFFNEYWTPLAQRQAIPLFPVDPSAIAREFGVDCSAGELDRDLAGAIIKQRGHDPYIVINASDSVPRQRFTAAHELGHLIDHMGRFGSDIYDLRGFEDEYEFVDHRDNIAQTGRSRAEVRANAFAASLLMPSNHFVRAATPGRQRHELVRLFGVSKEAIGYRLFNLGLLRSR